MEKIEVELLSKSVNQPVLRIPGCKFPGLLIQGDSLNILRSNARAIYETIKNIPSQNADQDSPAELARELLSLLDGYLEHYKTVLNENNIELPFSDG